MSKEEEEKEYCECGKCVDNDEFARMDEEGCWACKDCIQSIIASENEESNNQNKRQ